MKAVLFLFASIAAGTALAQTAAHATLGALTIPTYAEGAADPNPPFDQFQGVNSRQYVYPYTMRTTFSNSKATQDWRAVRLENEYLLCTILPDLGGHVYGCLDKIQGRDMFYNNSSIKKDDVGLRGSWAALGLESNFPNGHSWISSSPVDFAFSDNVADGSASVTVGNVDRVTGMQWRCEFVLRPGVAVLEQHVTLENRSNVRRRYYFWSNAAVRLVSPQDRFILPTNLASVHGSGYVDTWPIGISGTDWSVMNTYRDGAGYFALGSREEFAGVYQPGTKTGLLHVASTLDVPGKKTWNWGTSWWPINTLSDDGSNYVEIQAGATDSQEHYVYLEPQQIRTFQEYWMPIRRLGGVSAANTIAALNLVRTAGGGMLAELLATRTLVNAKMQLWQNGQILRQVSTNITPQTLATLTATGVDGGPVTFRLVDSTGALLLERAEGPWNAAGTDDYPLGLQPAPSWLTEVPNGEDEWSLRTDWAERLANYDYELNAYSGWESVYPDSARMKSGRGRLRMLLGNVSAAVLDLNPAAPDAETQYYGALARQDPDALAALASDAVYGLPASLRLAQLLAGGGDPDGALAALRVALPPDSRATRGGAIEIALLRALGRTDEAAARLAYWLSVDPTDIALRYEQGDPGLNAHLAADADRVLALAEHLMALGQYTEALALLSASYDSPDTLMLEPSVPLAAKHPLIWYCRGFCKSKLGQSGVEEYRTATALSVQYVFPNRLATLDVLNAALRDSPDDASALWLRGCIYLAMRRIDDAIADWSRVRILKPTIPSLHRTLGRTWLDVKHDKVTALPILTEGLKYEPQNFDLLQAIQRAK